MIIQFCGMSGAGKTTLAQSVKSLLQEKNIAAEVIDADEYRQFVSKDLGFSKPDRCENIRRLAFIAGKFSSHGIVAIICAINPYEEIRQEIKAGYKNVKTVFIDCDVNELIKRDTKGLYKKALLPDADKNKLANLTGINDPFERAETADLVIHTDAESVKESAQKLENFIKRELANEGGRNKEYKG